MEESFHLQFGERMQRGVGLVYMLICMANRPFAGASQPRWLHFLNQIGKSKVFSLKCQIIIAGFHYALFSTVDLA